MSNTIKMLLLSLVTSAVLLGSISANADVEKNSVNTEQLAPNLDMATQDAGALNLDAGSSDNWWGWGGWGGYYGYGYPYYGYAYSYPYYYSYYPYYGYGYGGLWW